VKFSLLLCSALLLLTGCGERGDKAIAYGKGKGREWTPAGPGQLRIGVENYFTRDVIVMADAPGVHYELTVGPIRERYMIVPEGKYEVTAVTKERNTGMMRLHVDPEDIAGAKGLRVQIR
jgi:hypothetical protein